MLLTTALDALAARAPRNLFFTGKGGVGKTSVACATAIRLAALGRRVLLVSTDPASNLDEVLTTPLSTEPTEVRGISGLFALNIDPEAAAAAYRDRVVGPYRNLLPPAAIRSIEEQLSGACTVEIAAFDEFSRLLADPAATGRFDHVVYDTAPTGHTLRLLELPAAWSGYLESSAGGASCLGPLAGLQAHRERYSRSHAALADAATTLVVLVARAEQAALGEAARTARELGELGVGHQELVINGVFECSDHNDPVAVAWETRQQAALAAMPAVLAALPTTTVALLPFGIVGIDALRSLGSRVQPGAPLMTSGAPGPIPGLADLLPGLARPGHGVIFTMGKGGVGKTSAAVAVARGLAKLGHRVHLTTTDPAAHVVDALGATHLAIEVSRIDPEAETKAYTDEVLATAGRDLDAAGRALLVEDLRSPCTEEIAVFRALARVVDAGERGFVVIDTAPTGHTLLLLDAAEAYHREVLRTTGAAPDDVRRLLPRLRDPDYTRVLVVTLPEATPVHEAAALQRDLQRAGIEPYAWLINQSLTPLTVTDPTLIARRASEAAYLDEVARLTNRRALVPWDPLASESTSPIRTD